MDCLASLTQKDVKGLVETFNTTCVGTLKDQAIGYMPIKRIGALAYAVDKCNRRNERFDITTWNATAIQEVRSEMSDLVEGAVQQLGGSDEDDWIYAYQVDWRIRTRGLGGPALDSEDP